MMTNEKKSETQRVPLSSDAATKRVRSDVLLDGRQELIIEHAGREYVLRITQNGKLILTA